MAEHLGDQKPVTERSNELTQDIDVVAAEGIVRIMRGCDAQIFSGYKNFVGLGDLEIQRVALAISNAIFRLLSGAEPGVIIIAGAGTSDRLAFLLSHTFNEILVRHGARKAFRYFIAGGDKALLKVQERSEDNAPAGIDALKKIEATAAAQLGGPCQRFFLVGVSCGLTAPCLAAQIEYALERLDYSVALVGFNPEEMAGKTKVTPGGRSFADVATGLLNCDSARHFVCNPVVGPEAISGSTRLKSGSATKILLEIIFGFAVSRLLHVPASESEMLPEFPYVQAMAAYASTWQAAYGPIADLARLVEQGAECLSRGGRISYIGSRNAGLLGMIDASEQVPTFGAHPEQFRGFVAGFGPSANPSQKNAGDALPARDGEDSGSGCRDKMPDGFSDVSADYFLTTILPSTRPEDMVVVLYGGTEEDVSVQSAVTAVVEQQKMKGVQVAFIEVGSHVSSGVDSSLRSANHRGGQGGEDTTSPTDRSLSTPSTRVQIHLRAGEDSPLSGTNFHAEFAMKLALNVFSTGAHVRIGKVYRSLMVDLRISNVKLFHRAVNIVAEIGGVTHIEAQKYLLEAIYGDSGRSSAEEILTGDLCELPISSHVAVGAVGERIVPKALLLATGKYTLRTAESALQARVSVRNLLMETRRDAAE